MFRRLRWKRGSLLKTLPVVAGALILALVPFCVGSGEETPSVEDVRIQVERLFASEGGPALQFGGDSAAAEESSHDR